MGKSITREDFKRAVGAAQAEWDAKSKEVDTERGNRDVGLDLMMMLQNFAFASLIENELFGKEDN